MQVYVGYGFDTNEIENNVWLTLVDKYDKHDFAEYIYNTFLEKIKNGYIVTDDDKIQKALEFINKNNTDCCEYLRNIINSEESEKANTNYIVTNYDNYLVFDSIRFSDDSKRTEHIRNAKDFIAMISRYIPTENLTFGNLYEGTDWHDPIYTLDK